MAIVTARSKNSVDGGNPKAVDDGRRPSARRKRSASLNYAAWQENNRRWLAEMAEGFAAQYLVSEGDGAHATNDSLERQADAIGGTIGAELEHQRLSAGVLPASARATAERHLGKLPWVTVGEVGDGGLASGALASAHGTEVRFREGAIGSEQPSYRAVLGHELVHVAQQQRFGPRVQNLIVDGVKVPEVNVRLEGDERVLLIDKVPVLKSFGPLEVSTNYDASALTFSIAVRASETVTPLQSLRFLDAMYPALAGRLVIGEPAMTVAPPREGVLPQRQTAPLTVFRPFGAFGRVPRAVLPRDGAATAARAPVTPSPHRAPAPPPVASAASAPTAEAEQPAEGVVAAEQEKNPYRTLGVPARAEKVKALLKKWFTARDIVEVFQASSSESEFLALERATDFGAVLDKLDEWDLVRLGAAGPILPQYIGRVNRARADFMQRTAREWGPQRAEIFALFIIDTTTDDEIESMLSLLAGDQELYRTVGRMPHLAKRLADRGIDINRFKDREWKAIDIATGIGNALDSVMATAPAVREARGGAAFQQGLDLPEPYRQVVHDLDMAAFMQAFTPGNVALAAADLAFLGLPSTVKGVVYDLPKSVVSGFDELAKGHVSGGVELLAVPAIMVITAALGVRAYRRARVAALLELTVEGKALYDSLKSSIGASGIQRVAGYVQKNAAARVLVAEAGADGIVALHTFKGDTVAARALLAERQRLIAEAGAPSGVWTGTPGTAQARPREVPYTQPPDMQVVRLGSPLRVENLNSRKRYLWVLDEQGSFRVAAEGQGDLFPRRGKLGVRHPQAGETPLKHGDLTPGPDGQMRGVARAGGEFRAELGPDGKPTGRWLMNLDSSYAFARLDEVRLGAKELNAAHRLLETTGTDITKIVPVPAP
jgi:hypothetical protein